MIITEEELFIGWGMSIADKHPSIQYNRYNLLQWDPDFLNPQFFEITDRDNSNQT